MNILLTNDDGIYAPGLAALEREMRKLGDVTVIAPATEQSGVGHSITYLTPLLVKEVFDGDRHRGWAVEGSPADCVKLGVAEFSPQRPDLVVSGINYGLNSGINVLYSGTVAAAIEGAFFELPSVAVSLEYEEPAEFDRAAALAREVIERILAQRKSLSPGAAPRLFNVNIPTAALHQPLRVKVVPMDVARYDDKFEARLDPRGRKYFWLAGARRVSQAVEETDLSALREGYITLTPLDFDLTHHATLATLRQWTF